MNTQEIVRQLDQEIERLSKARSFLVPLSSPNVAVDAAPVSRRGGRRAGAGRPRKQQTEVTGNKTASKVYAEPTVRSVRRPMQRDVAPAHAGN